MKKYVNGKYIEMTAEEIEEMKAKMPEIPQQVKTKIEERVEKIEKFLDKIKSLFHID
jgi:uncharacterized protein YlzI (FlbEa/FlbD family)